jgi:hypothetical protein
MFTVVIGFAGLAVDSSMSYGHQRDQHNGADAAALAAVTSLSKTWALTNALTRHDAALKAAQDVAVVNGFVAGDIAQFDPTDFNGNVIVSWILAQGVHVRISRGYQTTLLRTIGTKQLTVVADATAIYGYPFGVNNVVPIQIASDAILGPPGTQFCVSPGGCPTNMTVFQPPNPPCTQVPSDPNFDPCFLNVVQNGLATTQSIKIGPATMTATCLLSDPGCYLSRSWSANTSVPPYLAPWQALHNRMDLAPSETYATRASGSPRVFFATIGPPDTGGAHIPVSGFQCVWLKDATATSLQLVVADNCITTVSAGEAISKDPPGNGNDNRSAVVIRLIG